MKTMVIVAFTGTLWCTSCSDSSGDNDGRDLNVGSGTFTVAVVNKIHCGDGDLRSVLLSPDETELLLGSIDGAVRSWDIKTGEIIKTVKVLETPISTIRSTDDGKIIYVSGWEGDVAYFNVSDPSSVKKYAAGKEPIIDIHPFQNGRRFYSMDIRGKVNIWEPGKEAPVFSPEAKELIVRVDASTLCSPDGKIVGTQIEDGTITLWDIDRKAKLGELKGHTNDITSLNFSPDGKLISTSSDDGSAIIWDAAGYSIRYRLAEHTQTVWTATFSSDGTKIVTASEDDKAIVWNVSTGKSIHILQPHIGEVSHAIFSPDDSLVCTVDQKFDGNVIRLWATDSGKQVWESKPADKRFMFVAFSKSGKYLVAVNQDGHVYVWSIA